MLRLFAILALLLCTRPAALAAVVFELPFEGTRLSADGQFVVGNVRDSNNVPLPARWSLANGTELLGPLPDGAKSATAVGVSDSGDIIVGNYVQGDGSGRPFRWTKSNGLSPLSDVPPETHATNVSGDGQTIVGYSAAGIDQAFLWRQDLGMLLLGTLDGQDGNSRARAASHDGKLIVGESTGPTNSLRPFRWSLGGGMQALEADGPFGSALDIAADGQTVVGVGNQVAFRWTQPESFEFLGDDAKDSSRSFAVTADGAVVVGQEQFRAFMWDGEHGQRFVRDLLIGDYAMGRRLSGVPMDSVLDISDDGTRLLVDSSAGEFYLVVLSPTPLPGDADGDGDVDLADFGILKANFGTVSLSNAGDFDGNGHVELLDFAFLKENFGRRATATPEPPALLLAAFAALGFAKRAIRKLHATGS